MGCVCALLQRLACSVGRGGTTYEENGSEEQTRRPPSLNQSGAAQSAIAPYLIYGGIQITF